MFIATASAGDRRVVIDAIDEQQARDLAARTFNQQFKSSPSSVEVRPLRLASARGAALEPVAAQAAGHGHGQVFVDTVTHLAKTEGEGGTFAVPARNFHAACATTAVNRRRLCTIVDAPRPESRRLVTAWGVFQWNRDAGRDLHTLDGLGLRAPYIPTDWMLWDWTAAEEIAIPINYYAQLWTLVRKRGGSEAGRRAGHAALAHRADALSHLFERGRQFGGVGQGQQPRGYDHRPSLEERRGRLSPDLEDEMPSNTHHSFTAPMAGFPEEATPAGSRPFYLGMLAHLPASQPPVVLRLNEDEHDEVLLYPGSTRLIGRNPNRPIRRWQSRCLGLGDATLSIEFTEEPQPDGIVWHGGGAAGPAGPMGPAGPQGDAGPLPGALVRVRAVVGVAGLLIPALTSVDLIADVVSFDIGGVYNGGTGVFTVPVDQQGVYHVHALACTTSTEVRLELNTSSDGGMTWGARSVSASGKQGTPLSDYVTLAAGEQLKFVLHNEGNADTTCEGLNGTTARSYLLVSRIA
ncbi:MAG: hypothetical protein R3F65_32015 [bacterium]